MGVPISEEPDNDDLEQFLDKIRFDHRGKLEDLPNFQYDKKIFI